MKAVVSLVKWHRLSAMAGFSVSGALLVASGVGTSHSGGEPALRQSIDTKGYCKVVLVIRGVDILRSI